MPMMIIIRSMCARFLYFFRQYFRVYCCGGFFTLFRIMHSDKMNMQICIFIEFNVSVHKVQTGLDS